MLRINKALFLIFLDGGLLYRDASGTCLCLDRKEFYDGESIELEQGGKIVGHLRFKYDEPRLEDEGGFPEGIFIEC